MSVLTGAIRDRHPRLAGGWLSLVFSNSSGEMWALVQRAVNTAGFVLEVVAILSKGQRSVKGLASGFENVVTVDLILSMRKAAEGEERELGEAPEGALAIAVDDVLSEDAAPTPSHVYLGVIRDYLARHWDVSDLDTPASVSSSRNAAMTSTLVPIICTARTTGRSPNLLQPVRHLAVAVN